MFKVKYGGKKGKSIELVESPDLIAVRTKGNQDIEEVRLSRSARAMIDDTMEVASFPDAGVSVRRVATDTDNEFESIGARDAMRSQLKEEENIRFAGRVLQDAETGEVMLYTENFFVKFYDKVKEADCEAVLAKYDLKIKNKLPFANNAYFVEASEGTGLRVFNIAEEILKEKIVEYCHPELVQERRFRSHIHPLQWHLDKTVIANTEINQHVNIKAAWVHTKGKGITIAVIDDGVDTEHPEFKGRVVHPFDASLNINDAKPKLADDNHGTACAGVACASGLKDGASGVAPESFLLPIRLRSGLGSMAEANAFAWAADHGADVINCSWGPTDGEWWNPSDPLHNRRTPLPDSTRLAIEYAQRKGRNGKGCVILFAAGNGNEDIANDGYASNPAVIAVAACNDRGFRSVYSDYGDAVWVSFPSGDYGFKPFRHPAPISEGLRTTDRQKAEGYTTESYINFFGGTSGATPGVSGVVALMLAVNPDLTPAEVKDLLRHACVRIDEAGGEYDAAGHSIWYGYGRVDAGKAVQAALDARKQAPAKLDVVGELTFLKAGTTPVKVGENLAGDMMQPDTLLTVALRLHPKQSGLSLRYQVNVSAQGIRANQTEGEAIGADTNRRRAIGFSAWLEGPDACKYDVIYTAKIAGSAKLQQSKNGEWCGSKNKTGKAIEALAVFLKKVDA
ncbi:MAG: S8 family serine peptidase [Saprospiraceae bacterium]